MPRELYVAAERKELFEQAQDDDELCDMLLQDAAELDDVHEACEMEEVAIWSLDDAHSRRIRALQPFDYGEAVRGKPKIVNIWAKCANGLTGNAKETTGSCTTT